MQPEIKNSLIEVVKSLYNRRVLPSENINIEVSKTPSGVAGDYSTNLALSQSKISGIPSSELAQIIIKEIGTTDWLERAEIAPPGFINFYCKAAGENNIISQALKEKDKFGSTSYGLEEQEKDKILVEYVSVNPTGPLHTGHGRAAAIGSSLVNILRFVGHEIDGEFYVNDGGRQMQILTATFILRLMQLQGFSLADIPPGMYQGEYITQMARTWLINANADTNIDIPTVENIKNLIEEEHEQEKRLDRIIELINNSLGNNFANVASFILEYMMQNVREDLDRFGVKHDSWYYESSTIDNKEDIKMLSILKKNNYAYEKEGALWFNSKKFGDDKDRVLKRSNGNMTYFANDIAYHNNKYERGYDKIIDVLGADHHGYITRIRSSMQALGKNPATFDTLLIQLAFLVKDGKRVSMSTRADKFETLASLMDSVGVDAARFFYLMYRSDRQMDFDFDLAAKKNNENPVYYIQYAHARICSLFDELGNKGENWYELKNMGIKRLELLIHSKEKSLIKKLNNFSVLLFEISKNYKVHYLAVYLRELAAEFHSYYNYLRILDGTDEMSPRLCLCYAIKVAIANGLNLLGINAPKKM